MLRGGTTEGTGVCTMCRVRAVEEVVAKTPVCFVRLCYGGEWKISRKAMTIYSGSTYIANQHELGTTSDAHTDKAVYREEPVGSAATCFQYPPCISSPHY